GDPADAIHETVAEGSDQTALLILGDLVAERHLPRLGDLGEPDGGVEGQVDAAIALGEDLGGLEQGLEILGLLLAPGELVAVAAALHDPLVVDGHRDEADVVTRALEHRVHLPGEQSGLRLEELPGPAAAALENDLPGGAGADELPDVGAEGRRVEDVPLEGAPEKEGTASAQEGAEGEEGEVRARRHGGDVVAAPPQHPGEDQVVHVALVAGGEDQG